QDGGVPQPVQRVLVCPPQCRLGTISDEERALVRARSPVGSRYDTPLDRESAFEVLAARAAEAVAAPPAKGNGKAGGARADAANPGWLGTARDMLLGTGRRQGMLEAMGKSTARRIGNQLANAILRGVLGSISGGKR